MDSVSMSYITGLYGPRVGIIAPVHHFCIVGPAIEWRSSYRVVPVGISSFAYAEWEVWLIITFPKARPILLNGAVRKRERVVTPLALDSLLRVTFPLPVARVKATERLEAVYPTLKEIALAGSRGSKAIKHLAQQILSYAIKAAGEGDVKLM
ncbi:hypothetical protein SESBI_33715 [Sesbania bispinosa]|nr:hypothetical protein SESBI_33715 [Sesbania bispinosa]